MGDEYSLGDQWTFYYGIKQEYNKKYGNKKAKTNVDKYKESC